MAHTGLPDIASSSGNAQYNYELSYLPGQRLSRCTCPSDDTHPGPKNPDGTWVGRAAPEIDLFEAQVDSTTLTGHVSQSAQWAPFNPYYNFVNTSSTYTIYDDSTTALNTYLGEWVRFVFWRCRRLTDLIASTHQVGLISKVLRV